MTWLALLAALVTGAPSVELVPEYPGAEGVSIGSGLQLGWSGARLAYFLTDDPPARVIEHFVRRWSAQGLPVTVDDDGQASAIVSAFHTLSGTQQAVIVARHGARTFALTVAVN